ncbi:hypothetical protein KI387_041931 [Taxus chinensis]|uniref:Myosin XI n=1 Tax=Taxus chinensis TaxID=29808 RepID=A0AA38C3U1_TAXCH|nr:hypothetical protein KI387_041931 [Taxus chinensis]
MLKRGFHGSFRCEMCWDSEEAIDLLFKDCPITINLWHNLENLLDMLIWQAAPINILVGSQVWVEDSEVAWIDGEVLEINGQKVKVQATNGKMVVVNLPDVYPKDSEALAGGVDDMTKLAYLHEPGVLQNFRFGKFVELQFDKNGRISGAAVRTYLLERSRVCQISDPERNYHCFYLLCAAPPEDAIFRVVAAILHLGNVDFTKGKDADSSKPKDEKAIFHLKMAAELFMCDVKGLEDSLCKRVIVTRDESITKSLDPVAAVTSRDALAKTVYSRLFDWLVNKINNSIGQDPNSKTLIGVLDIYGFESFKNNSFEQFCINLTNEKLQQHFNQHVFKMEQDEYTKEEIDWSYIEFVDNQDVLDLIEKKPGGIVALLDEACMFPRSTHETFAQKLYQTFKNNKRFSKPKLSRTDFTICHYAGDVTYQTDLFLDKNKDYVVAEHQGLLSSSKCSFVASLFPALPEESSKSSKFSSIGTRFKQQLQSLLETLSSTEPHYIRCVKPNSVLKPGIFENYNVLQQLRCGGVMEAIRISCAGYPTRRTFDEFLDRFGILAPEALDVNYDEKSANKILLEKMRLQGFQIGKTKVFLRAGQMAELDARRTEVLGKAAKIIQQKFRSHIARKDYLAVRNVAIHLQALWRGNLARELYINMRREAAAVRIQKHVRRYLACKAYTQLQLSAVVIQAGLRAMAARNEFRFRSQTKASIIIQTQWRAYRARTYYKKLKMAAITFQCAWRGRVARKELRQLKMAAKETGALQEAKSKLEKQVEELTWRLQLEKRMRADLEEAKSQETAKLQSALQEMEVQVRETNILLEKEREVAKKAMEQVKTVIETPVLVVDAEKLEIISNENEKLKALISSLEKKANDAEKKADEVEKKYVESQKLSEERLRKAEEAESEIEKLKDTLQRFEAKLLNAESEAKVIRQQTLVKSPIRAFSERLMTTVTQTLENGYHEPGELSTSQVTIASEVPVIKEQAEVDHKPPKPLNDMENKPSKPLNDIHDSIDTLIKCVSQDIGFSQGRPIAACIIYKTLFHWRSFEAERTSVFDRIIQMIGSAIENQENNDILAYWLSNTSTLLFFLQRTLKATGAAGVTPQKRRSSTTLLGRMTQGFRSSPSAMGLPFGIGGLDAVRQVEAKYPALLFKQQLTAYVEKIYGIIRDNVKKDISALLTLCIQAPRTSRASMVKASRMQANASVNHWQSICKSLTNLLQTMRANNVSHALVNKILTQIFAFINAQLFNSLLLRRECCSFSNGEYLKAGLAELELWCYEAKEETAGSAWDALKHLRQAVGFLVIHQKPKKSLDEITHDLCPVLSIQQLYRISTMYWDDKYGTHSVNPDVIANMRVLMTEDSNSSHGNSFLLDDDSSIPFSVDDISKSMRETDLSDINPPPQLLESSAFQFLLTNAE